MIVGSFNNTLEIVVCSCTDGSRNIQGAPVRYVTKTWSVVLLNKKNTYTAIASVLCMTVVKTPTIISNKPVYKKKRKEIEKGKTIGSDRHTHQNNTAVLKTTFEERNASSRDGKMII